MELQALSALLLCFFSVFGLYAIFLRLAAWLSSRGALMVALDGRDMTEEEILLWTAHARFLIEREGRLSERPVVLLSENDEKRIGTLRKEGVLVFVLKNDKTMGGGSGDE